MDFVLPGHLTPILDIPKVQDTANQTIYVMIGQKVLREWILSKSADLTYDRRENPYRAQVEVDAELEYILAICEGKD